MENPPKHKPRRKRDKSTALVTEDQAIRWRVQQIRLATAMDCVVDGRTSSELRLELQRIAQAHPELECRSWYIGKHAAIRLMDQARKELGRELSRKRVHEYFQHRARLDRIYRDAMRRGEIGVALMAVKEQTALSERAHGMMATVNHEGEQIPIQSRAIGNAISLLEQSIRRATKVGTKSAERTQSEPSAP